MLTLGGFKWRVDAVAFSPDGRTLASAGTSRQIRLWDAVSGEPAGSLRGPEGATFLLAFAASGALASAGSDVRVNLWDLISGRPRVVDEGSLIGPLAALACARRGEAVLAAFSTPLSEYGAGESVVHVHDPARGPGLPTLTTSVGLLGAAFAPDGRTVALGATRGLALLWDLDAARRVEYDPDGPPPEGLSALRVPEEVIGPPRSSYDFDPLRGVAFSPDGRRLFGHHGKVVARWDVAEGRFLGASPGHRLTIRALAVAPAGGLLAAGGVDGVVRLLDFEGRTVSEIATGVERLASLAFAPDGGRLAAGGKGAIAVWDVDL